MVLGFELWMFGGARKGFYAEFYEVQKFDPIMEVSYTEKVAAFLPGIEPLALGFVAFVILLSLSAFIERKESSAQS